jgi:predicted Co/Zn/Cd cation transporter (cation efflux family)
MNKQQVSKIFVKWGLPTRQRAINEILSLHERELSEKLDESWRSQRMIALAIQSAKGKCKRVGQTLKVEIKKVAPKEEGQG